MNIRCSGNDINISKDKEQNKTKGKSINITAPKNKFYSINEVYNLESSWTNLENPNRSCDLHFNLSTTDTLTIEYSPECYLMFPIQLIDNKISVFMNPIIDTKYEFEIVKTIGILNQKYNNEIFIELTLIDDTTLMAKYNIKEIYNMVNKAEPQRILFPTKFYHTNRMSFESYH